MGLATILEVEPVGDDVWRAWTPPGSGRSDIYGGQVAGQALRAASYTAPPGHVANSVHCHFLRRGRPDLPLDIHVDRVRAGRTYSSRRVDVRQDDKVVFTMLASFHVEEPGRELDHPMPAGVPDPEDLSPSPPFPGAGGGEGPAFEMRSVETGSAVVRWWGRVSEALPADPAVQLSALLYASDMRAGGAAMSAVGYHPGPPRAEGRQEGNFGSLDHAVWFHRVPAVDQWFFCEVTPLTVRDSRGLVLGTMFDREGRHLASFTQEVFLKAA